MSTTPAPGADVIVVGGGNAALCAALTARQHVDRVLVLEVADKAYRGGNTRHTRNIRHIHSTSDRIMTGTYTEEEMWEDILRVSDADVDEDMARLVIRQSESLPEFMEANGAGWQAPLRGTLHLSRTNRFFLGGGKALLNAYYATAARRGVEVRYETPVVDIPVEGGRAPGVVVSAGGESRLLEAGAVVVASGGFEANREWLEQYWGEAARRFKVRGSPYNVGTPLRALLDKGVVTVGDPKGAHAISVDARAPDADGGIITRIDAVPFSIVVNKLGERFADEGEDLWPRRYASWGHLIAAQPDQAAFSVFDARVRDSFIPSVYAAHRADTLEDLARTLCLPWEAFDRTVRGYNAAVRRDVPVDHSGLDGCGTTGLAIPKSNWASPIDTPPFYAYPLRPGITFTYLGVKVDGEARVLGRNGPLANVFAAGEIMSGNVLTAGYLAGFGLTIGTVFGRIAGASAGRTAAA